MAGILIVDDDPQLRSSFEKLLASEGHRVRTANSGEAGLEAVRNEVPDLVVMDVRMPGMNGLEAFEAMRKLDPKILAIIVTAFGDMDTAIRATKLGAYDYVLKPFEIPDFLSLVTRALEAGRFMRAKVAMSQAVSMEDDDALIGSSRAMQEVYKAIGRAAPTEATVLVRGESGTGKELVARALYQHSLRADKPFLVINCVAIPETLLESELFGYEKGAFTGAINRRVGKVEQAGGGTLFLDEIGDMPLSIQAKILRLLQEKMIDRLGGRQHIPVDVRIIAATNRDLESAVAEGRFREDLYYRLKVVMLTLPPLRDRREDIRALADYFLARFSRELGMENPGLAREAQSMLERHTWPGNVRELSNALHKALIFNRGGPIGEEDVLAAVGQDGEIGLPASSPEAEEEHIRAFVHRSMNGPPRSDLYESLVDTMGRMVVQEALEATDGNRTRAAKLLGISRPTLLAKIEKYGLTINTRVS